jgi:Putative Actinobacterial Holin-X, holin superfamily III
MTHPTGRPETGTQPEETLGVLIATASRDLSALVRGEIELAKTEIRQEAKNGAKGGAMFGAAAFLSLLAVILLSIALAEGLVELGVVPWLAFLIVTVLYLLVAGVLVLVGKKAVSRVGPPERTIRTSKETAAFLKNPRSGNGTSPTT